MCSNSSAKVNNCGHLFSPASAVLLSGVPAPTLLEVNKDSTIYSKKRTKTCGGNALGASYAPTSMPNHLQRTTIPNQRATHAATTALRRNTGAISPSCPLERQMSILSAPSQTPNDRGVS
jgi:hypothetical protein